jgi:hypothetical protein
MIFHLERPPYFGWPSQITGFRRKRDLTFVQCMSSTSGVSNAFVTMARRQRGSDSAEEGDGVIPGAGLDSDGAFEEGAGAHGVLGA